MSEAREITAMTDAQLRKICRTRSISDRLPARAELRRRKMVRALNVKITSGEVTITRPGGALARQMHRHFAADDATRVRLASLCSLLCRLGPAMARDAESSCNDGDPSDPTSMLRRRWYERRAEVAERRAEVIMACFPATLTGHAPRLSVSGDPRGYSLKVRIPAVPHDGNTWARGGEYGVPTS